MTPPVILFLGVVFTAFGGALGVIGIVNDVPTLSLIGWAIGGLASIALFVGLISWSVEIGVRSARR